MHGSISISRVESTLESLTRQQRQQPDDRSGRKQDDTQQHEAARHQSLPPQTNASGEHRSHADDEVGTRIDMEV